MKHYDLIVVGAGPAGLSAAIQAANCGMKVIVFDENQRPGGQLFKQIHKFFGSKEHKAKIRGIRIGEELLTEAEKAGVEVSLNSIVLGLFQIKGISVMRDDQIEHFRGENIIIATGAAENVIPFEGWTTPGVIGAGAAQTMMNLHGVMPGKRVLMVGSGNVGLVVSFQLLQAGCQVAAVIDAAPRIGGYGVHAAKVARTGVPFYLSHTVLKAEGSDRVSGVVIAEVDEHFQPIPGTEKHFDVDTICMAVGLSPMSQLARMAGCKMVNNGGAVPETNEYGETSIPGVFAAGDVAGIEEASSAMITGRIAALGAARRSEFIEEPDFERQYQACVDSLNQLRQGMFCKANKGKMLTETDEGYPLSMSLLHHGYMTEEELAAVPTVDSHDTGIHPVIECTQNIPCNPCQEACKFGCISVGENITKLPGVVAGSKCTGCGMCVANCPGQAIFLVDETYEEGYASITLPYEFLPKPEVGDLGGALNRQGIRICQAEVVSVKSNKTFDHTMLLTIKVPKEFAGAARFYKPETEAK
ncbi:MAG: FAD-dependent oxidoreductase [Firmicutes bacterium]|nr:FAD-dependent oxidoreductase [Bacillota bacterium]